MHYEELPYPVNDNYSINLYVALCMVSFVQSLPKITMFCGILIVIYIWSCRAISLPSEFEPRHLYMVYQE